MNPTAKLDKAPDSRLGQGRSASAAPATAGAGLLGGRRLPLPATGARLAVVGIWGLLVLAYGLAEPKVFLTQGTFRTIFGSQQALVFLCAALLCTVCVGEFVDLSVASVFGMAAIVVSVLNVHHGWGVWTASLAAILVAVGCGVVNGVLAVYVGVNTIVVTLGMGTLLLGLALWVSDLQPVSGLPISFSDFALHTFLGLPAAFWEGLALMLVFAYVLHLTPLGLHMRFVGASREVSRLSGVRVNRLRFGAFVVAGLISGMGGVLSSAATGGFDANVSQSYLLPTFAATFLGTAILFPGRFNPLGSLVAIYFLATGILGLQLLGVPAWVSSVFYGGVLVVAVTISTVLHRRAT